MHREILKFWFEETAPSQWWKQDENFDRTIIERYSAQHAAAARCELYAWRSEPQGRLAEIIILDQFSRNMFRDTPRAFAQDPLALALAQEAISAGADQALNQAERGFLYMPYMHSESLKIHEVATALFTANANPGQLDYELRHRAIIERFGRYPHRNRVLSRESTAAEIEFLQQPGSGF